ncbi:hypothetical protein MNAN1_003675 [Malassezia nana]|uniref:Uncharacterized protein n=1 Tax=Malassezia nana TaxID=180528 RepID=A0AAF0ELK5_9BASI|nr:hypothetical protein MNAN1_003675 [Malassezia nana]
MRSESVPLLHAYRHLIRSAYASTRFSRTRTRSIRQLLRADAEAAMQKAHITADEAQRTMSLLVLASLSRQPLEGPDMPSRPFSDSLAAHLAQRIVRNLASLSYHHLSPHTQMQPLHRRTGGSSSNTNKKPGSAMLDALLSKADEPYDNEQTPPAGLRLEALTVTPKPVRGPVQYRHTYWDGQQTDKHVRAAGHAGSAHGTLHELQERLDELRAQHSQLVQELGAKHARARAVHDNERPKSDYGSVLQICCAM